MVFSTDESFRGHMLKSIIVAALSVMAAQEREPKAHEDFNNVSLMDTFSSSETEACIKEQEFIRTELPVEVIDEMGSVIGLHWHH